MAELAPLDVALLPVWGWGPTLGPGHMDPADAAEALGLLRPRIAVPIHWGTIHPLGCRPAAPALADRPAAPVRAPCRRAGAGRRGADPRSWRVAGAQEPAGRFIDLGSCRRTTRRRSSASGRPCGRTSARGRWPTPASPGFDDSRPKSYVLEMLPYPSGEPHVGHLKTYAVGDAIAHFRRRNGFRVIHPMGYDAFGLPAENHAIRTGEPPRLSTEESIADVPRPVQVAGGSRSTGRGRSAPTSPGYYRWTQWIFLELLERGLAYRAEAPVQWCPKDATVLANEQVIDGRCERCGTPVVSKRLEQWFFRITEYADRLLDGFELLESWPEHVVTMQRNWIGRSEGAEAMFRCEERRARLPGLHDAARHAVRRDLLRARPRAPRDRAPDRRQRRRRRRCAPTSTRPRARSAEERSAEDREKTGVALDRTVTNPVNGEQIPMFVADYVLMEYGTGAIMAVPAHDQRDYEFAEKFGLEIRQVVRAARRARFRRARRTWSTARASGWSTRASSRACPRPRRSRRSPPGWRSRGSASRPSTTGCATGSSRASATGAARSRSSTASSDGIVPVPADQLPVELPEIEDYLPKGAQPAGDGRGLGRDRVPALRRPGAARDRHDGHLRRLLVVLPALPRSPQRRRRRGGARSPTTGCRSTSTSAGSSTRSCT